MKYKTLLNKLRLTEEDFEKIKNSVRNAEKNTTGEIAVALAPESAHYSFWELLAADLFAAIFLVILLPFSNKILGFYKIYYWQNEPSWILPVFFVITTFAAIVIVFYLANIPAIDRFVIPQKVRQESVTHRAFRYFTESGVYDTKDHSGILIFVSYMERQVRIIADSGISKKISQDMWDLIADELAENLKNKKTTEAFVNAIEKCSSLLEQYFPSDKNSENPNELSDGLVILEDSEW